MSKIVRSACPLDCFDACAFLVEVEGEKVVQVKGDPDHPVTRGIICSKGRAHLERLYSGERLKKPLKKVMGQFVEISWDEAIDVIVEKLRRVIETSGPLGIAHVHDCGYSGLSKSVDAMFFNHLGGVSVESSGGSLCWKAGIVAQKMDFGTQKGHDAEDLSKSKCMILWGRNPVATNIHFVKAMRAVQKNGGRVICIDPFKTKTAKLSDWHIPVKPGGDGALAFAMARILIDSGKIDRAFIDQHTIGYEAYLKEVMAFDMSLVESRTGLALEEIKRLADVYSSAEPASIVLGYGMQRYQNGGNNIRAIDALGAITGNIGVSGGGVTYSNKSISNYVAGYVEESEAFVKHKRTFKPAKVADFLLNAVDPQVNFLWVAKANPVVQVPDTSRVEEAIRKVGFSVVVDMFLTDTAKEASLVLPATSIFEESDFIFSSMYSPYLVYANQCVQSPEGMIGEYDLFKILAERMKLDTYPAVSRDVFFRKAFAPLMDSFGVTYEALCQKPFAIDAERVPWADHKFETPSGKFEFESKRAAELGLPSTICYDAGKTEEPGYPLRLITPHAAHSTNSQHFKDHMKRPVVYLAPQDARPLEIETGSLVSVISKRGEILCEAEVTEAAIEGTARITEGTWCKAGAVNILTEDLTCDYGDQAAYYDTFVKLSKSTFVKDA